MRILFKWPTIKRPKLFITNLKEYINKLSFDDDLEYEFLVSINSDDISMTNSEMLSEIINLGRQYTPQIHITIDIAKYTSKIDAINGGMANKKFDIFVMCADDILAKVPGFDRVIADDMMEHFGLVRPGALWYDDGRQDRIITVSVFNYALYRLFGYVYYPEYKSLYCDDEFTEVVLENNIVKKINTKLFCHAHTDITGKDHVYIESIKNSEHDRDLYLNRKLVRCKKETV